MGKEDQLSSQYSEKDEKFDLSSKPPIEKEATGNLGHFARVFQYADRLSWCLFITAFFCAAASGAALPLMTIIFGGTINKFNDFVSGGQPPASFTAEINHFLLWFIYLFIGKLALTYVANVTITIAATRTTRALREAFLEHTLRQEIWHFDKLSSSAIATQVTTNGNRINTGLAEKLGLLIQSLSMFFSAFIVALARQWKLSLIVMSFIPALFLIIGTCMAIETGMEAKIIKIYGEAANSAQEVLSSIRTLHAFWAQDKMLKKYDEYLADAMKIGLRKSPNWGILFSSEYFCVYSAMALAFWQGFRMYQSGEVPDVGVVFTVVFSVLIAANAISSLAPQITPFTNAASAAADLFRIIDKKSLLDPLSHEGITPSECAGRIEIRDIDFAYPARPQAQILHNFGISIPAGKTTALVGASGCGKSTLVALLERWYEPSSGDILLDGRPLHQYNTKWLRSRIRLVQQEPVLFRGTVYENVARGLIDDQLMLPNDEKMRLVQEACKASNAHDFVEELPQGYHTQVGERAGMLSGGQKQRIAIARSIISDPRVLLLDEATSALDPKAEKVVQDALNRVAAHRTTLVIAHKLSTVKAADSIAVVSYGKLVEQGTHEELIALDKHYAALVRAQDLGDGSTDKEEPQAEQAALDPLEQMTSLQETKTRATSVGENVAASALAKGTLNYSLVKGIYIMLREQKQLYWWFALMGLSACVGGATYPGQAIVFSRLLGVFLLTGDEARHQANFYSLILFVIALGQIVAYFPIGWGCNYIAQQVVRKYRFEIYRTMLHQDMDFFDLPENSSGALTAKLTSVPQDLQELLGTNLLLIFIVLINLVSSSALALAYGWKLALVVIFGGLPALLGAGYLRIRLEVKLEDKTAERFSESAAIANEAVGSIRTVASLTLEGQFIREYSDVLGHIVSTSIPNVLWNMLWFSISQSIDFLVQALGFWYGSKLLADGTYDVQQFYIIFIGVLFAGQAAAQFFAYTTSITKARAAANYILWMRTLKPTISEDESNRSHGPEGDGAIDIDHVEFRYKQRDSHRVLRGISMTIEPGQFVATVGPSGCGKSTLISLLERFYDPTSGKITLGGKDIKQMSPRLWREHMSLVQQEPVLYQGSVRENVSLGIDTDVTEDEVKEACRQANALDFVSSLPEGLDTPCGNRGLQFSGGQRQRIAIARALIRNPRLLLLDEATSALDTQSERVVQKTLDEAASTRTTIAVAHRLSTIRNANVIFVFANGKIAEAGSHSELLKQRGRYYEMCLAQSLDKAV